MTSEEKPVKLTYYQRNREKCIAQAKAYQAAHKEKYQTYFKQYWEKNKETLTQRSKEYAKTHREQINAAAKARYHKNKPTPSLLQCRRETVKKVREILAKDNEQFPLHPPVVEELKEEEVFAPLMIRQEGNFTISWD